MPLFTAEDLFKNRPLDHPSIIGPSILPERGSLLLVGKTGIGKSVLAFDIAFSLVLGRGLFGAMRKKKDGAQGKDCFPVYRSCRVLYIDTELGPSGCHERLQHFYPRHVAGLSLDGQLSFVTGEPKPLLFHNRRADKPLDNLDKLIEEVKPDVIIPDPLASFHEVDENESVMNVILGNLKRLQHKYGVAVILPHHETDKELYSEGRRVPKEDSTARARGHSSITAWADTVLRVTCDDETAKYTFLHLAWVKTRHGGRPRPLSLFVDFTRMLVHWIGFEVGDFKKRKTQFLDAYRAKYPLYEEDDDPPEVP